VSFAIKHQTAEIGLSAGKVRVCIDCNGPAIFGGIGTSIHALCGGLTTLGYPFLVSTTRPISGLPSLVSPWRHEIRRMIEEKCALLHCTTLSPHPIDLPMVFTLYDVSCRHVNFQWHPSLYKQVKAGCKQARLVIVNAECTIPDVMEEFGVPQSQIRVIRLAGTTSQYPEPGEEDLAAMEKLRPYILYPAGGWPNKNHSTMFKALELIPDIRLVLTGQSLPVWGKGMSPAAKERVVKRG